MTPTPKPAKTMLKPCPFCGKPVSIEDDPNYRDWYVVECRRCLYEISDRSPADLRRRWNRRTPLDPRPTGRED